MEKKYTLRQVSRLSRLFVLVLLATLGQVVFAFSLKTGASEPQVQPQIISCSPDKPTVAVGESISIRVFLTPPDQCANFSGRWTSEAGAITGDSCTGTWSFAAVRSGKYKATISSGQLGQEKNSCSIGIVVRPKERSGESRVIHESARSFLMKGTAESAGYGLYSYFLLGSPPDEPVRERYERAVEAYLKTLEEVAKLENYFAPSHLNVVYMLVDAPLPAEPSVQWVLQHYDYARARSLLDKLPGDRRRGPYLVSALRPLPETNDKDHFLVQDLTSVPSGHSDLVTLWIREFMNQAAQERFWQPRTAEQLILKMRTTIAVLALGLPDVQHGVDTWIDWLSGKDAKRSKE